MVKTFCRFLFLPVLFFVRYNFGHLASILSLLTDKIHENSWEGNSWEANQNPLKLTTEAITRRDSIKQVFLEILQNSQENNYTGVFLKRGSGRGTLFWIMRKTASDVLLKRLPRFNFQISYGNMYDTLQKNKVFY